MVFCSLLSRIASQELQKSLFRQFGHFFLAAFMIERIFSLVVAGPFLAKADLGGRRRVEWRSAGDSSSRRDYHHFHLNVRA
jgi:hypothetical protein